jgi:hypothetical protein
MKHEFWPRIGIFLDSSSSQSRQKIQGRTSIEKMDRDRETYGKD